MDATTAGGPVCPHESPVQRGQPWPSLLLRLELTDSHTWWRRILFLATQCPLTSSQRKTTIYSIKWVCRRHARSLLQPTRMGGPCTPLNISDLGVCSCVVMRYDADACAIPGCIGLHDGRIPGCIAGITGRGQGCWAAPAECFLCDWPCFPVLVQAKANPPRCIMTNPHLAGMCCRGESCALTLHSPEPSPGSKQAWEAAADALPGPCWEGRRCCEGIVASH